MTAKKRVFKPDLTSVKRRPGKQGLKASLGKEIDRVVADAVTAALRSREWVGPDDAPELTDEMIERADLYHGDKLVRRGRPPSDNPKKALKLRIDADVVEHFRATGPGWQTRINDALRRAAKLRKVG